MSNTVEIDWGDIRELAVVGYVGSGVIPTALFYERMEELSKKKAENPRSAWFMRPAIAAAKEINKVLEYADNHEFIGICAAVGCGLVGVAGGITAICMAAPWLGATWAGMLTLKGIGLGLGAFGIGVAAAPFIAAATSIVATLLTPAAVQIVRGWPSIRYEMIAGRAETREWKQQQEQQAGKTLPHPLVTAAEASGDEMAARGALEREQLFNRLQAKFPQEFAEAVRRSDTDTVLRNKVQVMKPVKLNLQPKKKTLAARIGAGMGGAA